MKKMDVSHFFVPRLVFWEIDKRCNLRCRYCRRDASSGKGIAKTMAFQAVDSIAKNYNTLLVFSGGEPLLYEHIFEVAHHARMKGLTTAIATNGTLVDRDTALKIKEAGFHRAAVSLDGARAETNDSLRGRGSFLKAVEGIRALAEAGVSVQINTTILRRNMNEMHEIHVLCSDLGADALHIFAFVPVGCGASVPEDERPSGDEYEKLLDEMADLSVKSKLEIKVTCAPHFHRVLKEAAPDYYKARGFGKGCLAGSGVCFISSIGEVYPCGYLPVSAGNIFSGGFKDIWEGSELFATLRDTRRLKGKCAACEYAASCGGCRARAFAATGNYLEEEPDCSYQPLSAR